jgi:hypothetical protein
MARLTIGLGTLLLALATSAFLSSAQGASAEVEGNCEATFAGVDVSQLDSGDTDDAIKVSEDDIVGVTFTSSAGFESHQIKVKFADIPGGSVDVEDEDDDGDTEWSGDVVIDDWAWAGAGLYKVEGKATLSDGTECFGAALIDVDEAWYTTVAGIVALVLTVFGVGSIGVAGVSSVIEGRRATKKIDEWVVDELESVSGGKSYTPPARQTLLMDPIEACCQFAIIPALILTGAAMASGESGPSEPSGGLGLPRATWRPRLSVSGVIGGIFAGIGVVVILQQSGQVFPNVGTLVLWLAIGLVLGVVIPSLIRALNVISVNRAVARAERRLIEAGALPAASPPGESAES